MTHKKCARSGCDNDPTGALCVSLDTDNTPRELVYCSDHIGDAEINYMLRNPRQLQFISARYEVCKLHKLLFLYNPGEYYIILNSVETGSIFLMRTGYVEACSIYGAINKPTHHPTPLTYQLFEKLIRSLDGSLVEACFDGFNIDYDSYESHLVISKWTGIIKVPCRGSDAVGISFLSETPIKVRTAFLGKAYRTAGGG